MRRGEEVERGEVRRQGSENLLALLAMLLDNLASVRQIGFFDYGDWTTRAKRGGWPKARTYTV